jgi:hypothetical protein
MSVRVKRWCGATAVVVAAATAGTAGAQELSRTDRKLFGGDLSFNGQFRIEGALSTSGRMSAANQFGLGSNNRPIPRTAGNPIGTCDPFTSSACEYGEPGTPWTTTLNPGGVIPRFPGDLGNVIGDVVNPGGQPRGVSGSNGVSDTFTRYIPTRDQDVNYHLLRFEFQPSINWPGGWSFISRLRAVYNPNDYGYQSFSYNRYNDINGGFETGRSIRQYDGKPDQLGYEVDGEQRPLLFEYSNNDFMVDLPAFFVQWTNGNVTARLGNQSVAWGQLLFFRIMDVANGLDLRRHLFLDRAIEEFADERMSAPGLRLTWQATDNIVVDAFGQQFIPTIVPNSNTTYNIVDSRFILHDNYYKNDNHKDFNFGVRFKGEFGNYNAQLMYTSRLNQLGAIRWRKSGVNKPLPDSNPLGAAFNVACEQGLIPAHNLQYGTNFETDNGCGPLLAETAFEVAPGGLNVAEEWFDRASYTKLDALEGLARVIDEFPAATTLLARPVGNNVVAAYNELNAFFIASEGLHGHVERSYFREDVFGVGGGLVTEGEPGSLFDQIIINVEATYTPDRKNTSVDLRQRYDERDEVQVGLVMEKYHRFSTALPATYMVFQYLWQKEQSLEGLLLDGYGSENYSPGGQYKLTKGVPTNDDPKITPGVNGGAHYVVLAALLPGPQYIFEYSVAALIDVQGGVLMQPGIQWKPRGNITVNVFYNYLDSDVWGNNPNKSFISFIDFADEFCMRLGYQF